MKDDNSSNPGRRSFEFFFKLDGGKKDLSRKLAEAPQKSLIDFETSLYTFGTTIENVLSNGAHKNYPQKPYIEFIGIHTTAQIEMMLEQVKRGDTFEGNDLASYLWYMDDKNLTPWLKDPSELIDDPLLVHCLPATKVDYDIIETFNNNRDYTLLSFFAQTMKIKANHLKS